MQTQKSENGTVLAQWPQDTIITKNPWNEMHEMRRRMDDLFSQMFGYTPLSRLLAPEVLAQEPEVDIHETVNAFQVLASLPGYTPEQIDVEATENTLTIQGERKALFEEEKAKTHRHAGLADAARFQFTYTLPREIAPGKITAKFANGMLLLELPKSEQAREKSVRIPIQTVTPEALPPNTKPK